MAESTSESKLDEVTRRLEAALERPVVPGELSSWANAASACCSHLTKALRELVEHEHAACFAAIEKQDPGLLHRIDQMREEDRALLDAAAGLDEHTSHLAAEAARGGPVEASLENARGETVKRGIDLVVRIRTQESALQTWYSEAFYRDRGTGD